MYVCVVLTCAARVTHRGALVPSVQVHQARVNVWLQHCSGCSIVLLGAIVGDDEEELHANEHVVLQPLHQIADVGGGVQPASSMNQHRRWADTTNRVHGERACPMQRTVLIVSALQAWVFAALECQRLPRAPPREPHSPCLHLHNGNDGDVKPERLGGATGQPWEVVGSTWDRNLLFLLGGHGCAAQGKKKGQQRTCELRQRSWMRAGASTPPANLFESSRVM
jgi:hypothetical protein